MRADTEDELTNSASQNRCRYADHLEEAGNTIDAYAT